MRRIHSADTTTTDVLSHIETTTASWPVRLEETATAQADHDQLRQLQDRNKTVLLL